MKHWLCRFNHMQSLHTHCVIEKIHNHIFVAHEDLDLSSNVELTYKARKGQIRKPFL